MAAGTIGVTPDANQTVRTVRNLTPEEPNPTGAPSLAESLGPELTEQILQGVLLQQLQQRTLQPNQMPPSRGQHQLVPTALQQNAATNGAVRPVSAETAPAPTPVVQVTPAVTAPVAEVKKPEPAKKGPPTAEVLTGLGEWVNNSVSDFLFGIQRERYAPVKGLVTGAITLAMGTALKGLTFASLFTPAGIPILGISAFTGLTSWATSYLLHQRHPQIKTNMPTQNGERRVSVSFGEFLNNELGNLLFGKKRERAPFIRGLIGSAVGLIGGLGGLFAPLTGPVGPVIAAATGAAIGGTTSATASLIDEVRRFKKKYPV